MVELITSRYFDLEEIQGVLRKLVQCRYGWWLPRWRKVVRYAEVEDAPLSALRAFQPPDFVSWVEVSGEWRRDGGVPRSDSLESLKWDGRGWEQGGQGRRLIFTFLDAGGARFNITAECSHLDSPHYWLLFEARSKDAGSFAPEDGCAALESLGFSHTIAELSDGKSYELKLLDRPDISIRQNHFGKSVEGASFKIEKEPFDWVWDRVLRKFTDPECGLRIGSVRFSVTAGCFDGRKNIRAQVDDVLGHLPAEGLYDQFEVSCETRAAQKSWRERESDRMNGRGACDPIGTLVMRWQPWQWVVVSLSYDDKGYQLFLGGEGKNLPYALPADFLELYGFDH